MLCSVQPRDRIFVKDYGLFSFAKNMSQNIGKNMRDKYSQKCLDHAKQSAIDTLKATSRRVLQETAEETGDLIGNKSADRITKVSKISR